MESPLKPLTDSGLQSCQQVPAVTTTTTPAEQGGSSADDSISHDADALANHAVDSTNNSGEDRLTGQNDIVSKEKRQNCPEKSELLSTISTESVPVTMASVDCTNTTVLTTDTLAESGSSKMIAASHLCDQDQGLSTIANRQNGDASSQDTTSSNLQETDHNLPRPVAVDGQPDQVAACAEHDNAQNRDTQAVSNCLEANSMQQHLTSSSQEDQLHIVDGGDSETQPIAADGGDSSETVKQGAPPLESGSEHSTISQVEEKLVVAIPPEKKKNIDESKPGSVGTVLVAARSDEAVTKEHSPVAAAAAPSDSAGAVSATSAAGATGAATCSRSLSEDKGSASECDNVDSAPSVYSVKWVMFKGNKVPIITQNENGPCPLIAIMNVLLLMKKIPFPAPMEMVTSDQLMSYLGEYVFERVPKDISEDSRLNYEQNMQDAMAVFHKLQTGLDVNVKFTGVRDFEYTPECIIFDLLDIRLYHGWLVDPQEPKVGEAIGNCSYNQLVEKIIALKSSDKEDQVTEALIAEAFLESSASQLTYHGLCELSTTVKEGELCVCFRNNHFSTLYRHKGELFILVTDQGFLTEPNVVWETLSNVEGDCHFVDANFHTYTKPELPPLAASDLPAGSEQQIDQDYLVALSLQQEQVEPGAVWNQQQQQQQGAPPSSQPVPSVPTVPLSDHELAMRLQEEEDRRAAAAFQQQQQQQQQAAAGPPAGPGGQQPRAPGGQPSGASGVRRPRDRDRDREKKDKDGCLIL